MDLEELGTYPLLNAGLLLFDQGRVFEAHEVWEYAWGAEVGRTKLTLQALIQIAAALHKHRTGNPRGTCKLLAKAKDKLAEVMTGASAFLGIDLVAVSSQVDAALEIADRIAEGETRELPPITLPKRTGSDGVLYLHGYGSGPTSKKASVIVPALQALGLHVEVPDLNEDDFPGLTITRALNRAKRCLRDRTLVIGSSLGGYLGALLAEKDDRAKALLLMAPAFDFADRMYARYGEGVRGHPLYEDAKTHPGRPKIRVPTYALMGRRDDVVSPEIVCAVAEAQSQFVELDLVDDDHGLVDSADRAKERALRFAKSLSLTPDAAPPDPDAILAAIEQATAKD